MRAARVNGHDLARIQSVASFFVSRMDTEVDRRLEAIGSCEALALRGTAAIANARYAFSVYTEAFTGPGWLELAGHGAAKQRPLWASTSTKNPQYPDTRYVNQLAVHGAVNTMPLTTLEAVADHGRTDGDTVTGRAGLSAETLALLPGVGVDADDVYDTLEREGVDKFAASWGVLHDRVQRMLDKARS